MAYTLQTLSMSERQETHDQQITDMAYRIALNRQRSRVSEPVEYGGSSFVTGLELHRARRTIETEFARGMYFFELTSTCSDGFPLCQT